MDQAKSLNRDLGKQDQDKLEEYFDSVRTLEQKIAQQEPWLDRPKPKTDVPEPNPANGTEHQLKAMVEIIGRTAPHRHPRGHHHPPATRTASQKRSLLQLPRQDRPDGICV